MLPDRLNLPPVTPAIPDKSGVNPVNSINPVLATASLGSASQEAQSKLMQLVKMHEYTGQVVSKASDSTLLVSVSGQQVKNLLLKMDLPQAQVGQSLKLQFMSHEPSLTFMLKPQVHDGDAHVTLTKTGHLIGQFIQEAQTQGLPKQYQAQQVVSKFPFQPPLMAKDLQQALARSGLFYESHLQAYSQGETTLQQVRLEPQNQGGVSVHQIVYQQLSALENQRLSWYGEVWPGQMMSWEVYYPSHQEQQGDDNQSPQTVPINTDLTLNMPQLGKVKASLRMVDGRLSVHLTAQDKAISSIMQADKASLAERLAQHHKGLAQLTIQAGEI